MAVEDPMATEKARVREALAKGEYKPEPGEHVVILRNRFGQFYNWCIFSTLKAAEDYKAKLEAENTRRDLGCSYELFSGRDKAERKMMIFIFLLFDRNDAANGVLLGKGVEFLPVDADDPEIDEAAQWARLRQSHNSRSIHMEQVMALPYYEGHSDGKNALSFANFALMGAFAAFRAAKQSEKEKTDPTYAAAEREGA